MTEKKRYYIAFSGGGLISGYVWLTKEQYAAIKYISNPNNWEEVNYDVASPKVYIGDKPE